MNITITGKELKATEAIKDYVEKKLIRVEKYFSDGEKIDVNATIKKENSATEIAEMYVSVKGTSYKAVTEDKDLYAAIDKDIDILEGQIRKTKAKKEKMQKDSSIKQMNIKGTVEQPIENEIIKSLYYEIKPISVDDAKLKLDERKGNLFYCFVNIDTGKVNVIYKLKDSNNYGLVEPEA